MKAPSIESTVGDLVVEKPGRSRVFAKLGIDFCCGGKKTLVEVCREKALDPAVVLAQLEEQAGPEGRTPWAEAPLADLVDHVERTHHAFTREELPRLQGLLDKVARVHGERHPNMVEVARIFGVFASEMLLHMTKEERVLFPAIRAVAGGRPAGIDPAMPIRVMSREHDEAGEQLRQMRELTRDYALPDGACNTFRAALAGLEEIEADMHQHVHLENNLMFPRALALGAGGARAS
jgi:regulator of cell morphogenesis and NO signaling